MFCLSKIVSPSAAVKILAGSLLLMATPAIAQTTEINEDDYDLVQVDVAKTRTIAVPRLSSPQSVNTAAGNTDTLSLQIAEVIASDLEASGVFQAIGPSGIKTPTLAQVTAPEFDYWRGKNANQLIQGFVRVDNDGKLLIGCYLYDVGFGSEQASAGFRVDPADWRRAAHKCADSIYGKLTGEMPFFDALPILRKRGRRARGASNWR
jgi:TolB protein